LTYDADDHYIVTIVDLGILISINEAEYKFDCLIDTASNIDTVHKISMLKEQVSVLKGLKTIGKM